MAYVRRRRTAAAKKQAGRAKPHTIDGICYKSGTLVRIHEEMKAAVGAGFIHSFTLPQLGDGQKKTKYGAYKAEVDGRIFDSVMEARFYVALRELLAQERIAGFECQKEFELQPKFRSRTTGRVVRPITYIADFFVTGCDGVQTAVDVKGQETPEFRIKKKLFEYRYPDVKFACVQWRASTGSWEDLEVIKAARRKKKREKVG